MRDVQHPTQEALNAAFEDVGTTIRWRDNGDWRRSGEVTCTDGRGYLTVKFNGRQYNVHRLLWIMRNGPIPDGMQIDHINADKTDNTPENMRLVSHTENMWNRRGNRNNTSGVKGVTWHKKLGKWQASISIGGKGCYLGVYESVEDAARAVRAKRAELHGPYANDG